MSQDDVLAEDDIASAAPEQRGVQRLAQGEPQRTREVLIFSSSGSIISALMIVIRRRVPASTAMLWIPAAARS